jgi:hypothetical protein
MDVDPDAIVVERRFEGPPGSGQGGWSSALFADRLPYRATVSLRAPIPFERPLRIEADGEGHRLVDDARRAADGGPTVIMTAREWTPNVPDTSPVTIDAARAARGAFTTFVVPHPVPDCFSCGTRHDTMGVHACPLDDGRLATDWTVPDWADHPTASTAALWAALDCTAAFYVGFVPEVRRVVTVQYAVEVLRPVTVGETLALVAWPGDHDPAWDGRKRGACSIAFDDAGRITARARSFWVSLPT